MAAVQKQETADEIIKPQASTPAVDYSSFPYEILFLTLRAGDFSAIAAQFMGFEG
jgi:hypothetical protein